MCPYARSNDCTVLELTQVLVTPGMMKKRYTNLVASILIGKVKGLASAAELASWPARTRSEADGSAQYGSRAVRASRSSLCIGALNGPARADSRLHELSLSLEWTARSGRPGVTRLAPVCSKCVLRYGKGTILEVLWVCSGQCRLHQAVSAYSAGLDRTPLPVADSPSTTSAPACMSPLEPSRRAGNLTWQEHGHPDRRRHALPHKEGSADVVVGNSCRGSRVDPRDRAERLDRSASCIGVSRSVPLLSVFSSAIIREGVVEGDYQRHCSPLFEGPSASGLEIQQRLAAPGSSGAEAWSCTMSQLPSMFWKQNVARTQKPPALDPFFNVPLSRLKQSRMPRRRRG